MKTAHAFKACGFTDKALREKNEDAFGIDEGAQLFVVCDGLGGHAGGEIASAQAVESITTRLKRGYPATTVREEIETAIREAHESILERASGDLEGMGTTVVLGLLEQDMLWVANVGDSRAYLFRDKKILLLSRDHSIAGELMRQGKISSSEVRRHPQRNIITQALGIEPFTQIYQNRMAFKEGDILIFCSDGLWEMLSEHRMEEIILSKPQNLCRELVKAAKESGGSDNITAVVVEINEA